MKYLHVTNLFLIIATILMQLTLGAYMQDLTDQIKQTEFNIYKSYLEQKNYYDN